MITLEDKLSIVYNFDRGSYLYINNLKKENKWILYPLLEQSIITKEEYEKIFTLMLKSKETDVNPLKEPAGILYINLLYNILKKNNLI